MQKTASGLLYLPLQEGSGESPHDSDKVVVNYRGSLPSGLLFDAGSLFTANLKQTDPDRVIAGWTEGLQLMKPGSKYRFYIPSPLAYGASGKGGIGPNAALVFDVELVRVAQLQP